MKTGKLGILIGLGALTVSQASASNLIINGDFESGTNGFSSDYIYAGTAGTPSPTTSNPNTLWDPGTYSVGTDPYLFHSSWDSFGDHTTGTGNMLLVNGASEPVTIWTGTLTTPLVAGQTYDFSAWVANLFPPPTGSTPTAPAWLNFKVDGTLIGSMYWAPDVGVWHEFTASFVATGNDPISVYDSETAFSGNDFALDDISLVAVPEPTTATCLLLGLGTLVLTRRFIKR
jgi:hypothetical protein